MHDAGGLVVDQVADDPADQLEVVGGQGGGAVQAREVPGHQFSCRSEGKAFARLAGEAGSVKPSRLVLARRRSCSSRARAVNAVAAVGGSSRDSAAGVPAWVVVSVSGTSSERALAVARRLPDWGR
ncbi:hypothetical protein GCM10010404_39330 [Nonomuraea africana]